MSATKKTLTSFGSFTGVRLTLAVTAFLIGASFCWAGSSWHSQTSFYYINQLPISWWVYGVALLIGGMCILIERIRPFGYLIGAIAYSFFALAVWLAVIGSLHLHVFLLSNLSLPPGSVGSFFAACNLTTICVLYWSALKTSIYTQVDPERTQLLKR